MILRDLNKEQKAAVTSAGSVYLTACPGSGKTRVIVHKIAYDIEQQPDSKRKIAAVTFTKRAANEIIRRIDSLGVNIERVWAGTIHSFCLEWILKPYYSYCDHLNNGYTIIDQKDADELKSTLKKEFKIRSNDEIDYSLTRHGDCSSSNKSHRQLLERYYQNLKSQKKIDFNLMLYYSYYLLRTRKGIPFILSRMFKLLCVDEFQDTQDLQYGILSMIVKAGNGKTNIFFSGDIDQAIYQSLGGVAKTKEDIENEIDLPLASLNLSGNYRSTQKIIDFYSLFQTNPISITSKTDLKHKESIITLNQNVSKELLSEEIASLIQYHLYKGVSEKEICVLAPQWWHLRSISKSLREKLPNVNFDASGLFLPSKARENFYYKLSRLLLTDPSPRLFNARKRWAKEILNDLDMYFNISIFDDEKSHYKLLKTANSILSHHNAVVPFLEESFDKIESKLGIVKSSNILLKESRKEFLRHIVEQLKDSDYLDETDISSMKKLYKEHEGILINTCAGVKGEEFEVVIAYGLLEGYIPHQREIRDRSVNEKERSQKSLYVICSRAKKHLHLIAETGRTTKKGHPYSTTQCLENINFEYDDLPYLIFNQRGK